MNLLLVSQTFNGCHSRSPLDAAGALTQPLSSVYMDSNDESRDEQ